MPLTNYGESSVLGTVFGNSTAQPTISQSWNVGLVLVKGVWAVTTSYAIGDLVIPTNFATTSGTPMNKIFRCTAAGTSGSSQPTSWTNGTATTGQTGITDGTVTWAEVTPYFYLNANTGLTAAEVGASVGYSRQTATNTNTGLTTNTWSVPTPPASWTSTSSASVTFGTALTFGASTGTWGNVAGFFMIPSSGSPTGPYAWNTLSNYVPMLTSGMTLTLPATTGITVTLQ